MSLVGGIRSGWGCVTHFVGFGIGLFSALMVLGLLVKACGG